MKWERSSGGLGKEWPFIFGLLSLTVILPMTGIVMGYFAPLLLPARLEGDRTFLWMALILAVVGIVLLFIARLPLYRRGMYFTFGSRALPRGQMLQY